MDTSLKPTKRLALQTVALLAFVALFSFIIWICTSIWVSKMAIYEMTDLEFQIDKTNPNTEQNNIEAWETYTNDIYPFSFQHPNLDDACCSIGGPNDSSELVVFADASTVDSIKTDKPFDGLGIFVLTKGPTLSFADFLDNQKNLLLNATEVFTDTRPTEFSDKAYTIDGQAATILIDYSWWGDILYVQIPNTDNVLAFVKSESSAGSFDAVFNQILSTFEFTEAPVAPVVDYSCQGTYTNTSYNYSFTCPTGWYIRAAKGGATEVAPQLILSFSEEKLVNATEGSAIVISVKEGQSDPLIEETYYGQPATITSRTTPTIGGTQGSQVTFGADSTPTSTPWIFTAVVHNDKTYLFNLEDPNYISEYNNILESFQFTN